MEPVQGFLKRAGNHRSSTEKNTAADNRLAARAEGGEAEALLMFDTGSVLPEKVVEVGRGLLRRPLRCSQRGSRSTNGGVWWVARLYCLPG